MLETRADCIIGSSFELRCFVSYPVGETQAELVEELDILEDVVVGGAGVGVLVVVAVDEQLDDGLGGVGGDEGLLLLGRGDERHPDDGHHRLRRLLQVLHRLLARVGQRLDAKVLGLGQQLGQLTTALWMKHEINQNARMKLRRGISFDRLWMEMNATFTYVIPKPPFKMQNGSTYRAKRHFRRARS